MKKIKRILILIILIIGGSLTNVYADGSSPIDIVHTIEITNQDGVKFYDYEDDEKKLYEKDTIPYKTLIKIYNVEKFNGVEYYAIQFELKDHGYDGYILKSSVNINNTFKVNEDDLSEIHNGYIFSDKVTLYEGPSEIFKSIGTTNGKCDFKFQNYNQDWQRGWIYASDINGKTGWIKLEDNRVVYKENDPNNKIITFGNVELYDVDGQKRLLTIPSGTKIEYIYTAFWHGESFHSDHLSHDYYVEYNGKKGFVSGGAVLYRETESELGEKEFNINEKLEENEGNVKLYLKGKEIVEIPKNSKINYQENEVYCSNWDGPTVLYITYKGKSGFTMLDFDEVNQENDIEETFHDNKPIDNPNPEEEQVEDNEKPVETNPTDTEKEVIDVTSHSLDSREIIILCVGGAIVIAVASIVTISLLNKKKENKISEPKKEEAKQEIKQENNKEIKQENNKEVKQENNQEIAPVKKEN